MRRIRFKPELIEKIRQGRKSMTFRETEKPKGMYIVEEGGKPYYIHVDSGIRIRIVSSFPVSNTYEYIKNCYEPEGFSSPQEFEDYLRKLYKGKIPPAGYGHRFEVVK